MMFTYPSLQLSHENSAIIQKRLNVVARGEIISQPATELAGLVFSRARNNIYAYM